MTAAPRLVRTLDALPDGTIYVQQPWTVESPAWVGDNSAPAGFEYLLEVELAQDAVEVCEDQARAVARPSKVYQR